jgi:hypothetical protein
LLFFLDDDACLPTNDILARMAGQFGCRPHARHDPTQGHRS